MKSKSFHGLMESKKQRPQVAAAAQAPLGGSPIVPYESKTKAKLATLNGDVDYKKVPSR